MVVRAKCDGTILLYEEGGGGLIAFPTPIDRLEVLTLPRLKIQEKTISERKLNNAKRCLPAPIRPVPFTTLPHLGRT